MTFTKYFRRQSENLLLQKCMQGKAAAVLTENKRCGVENCF